MKFGVELFAENCQVKFILF